MLCRLFAAFASLGFLNTLVVRQYTLFRTEAGRSWSPAATARFHPVTAAAAAGLASIPEGTH